MKKSFLFSLFVLFFVVASASSNFAELKTSKAITADTLLNTGDTSLVQSVVVPADSANQNKGNPEKKENNKKKLVAALLAFPFPLGFMGAHRVMLGTKPWVPIVYAATFGGCFGIIPMIDFLVIVCSKDTEQYENNPNVFMWIK